MTWIQRWKSISTKISQLQELSRAYFDSINSYGVDHYGIGGSHIIPAARDIFMETLELRKVYPQLPAQVGTLIGKLEKSFGGHKFTGIPGAGGALVILSIFNSEMNFYLKDQEVIAKNQVRLAFLHLQKTLMVDADVQRKWLAAYRDGDQALESLGGTYLLTHGLWAFKSRGATERLDLVSGLDIKAEEVDDIGASLVLTEWRSTSGDNLGDKAKEALAQARKYGLGGLPGAELKREKYLVLVSEGPLEIPPALIDGDIRYLYFNLVVGPTALSLSPRIKEGFAESIRPAQV